MMRSTLFAAALVPVSVEADQPPSIERCENKARRIAKLMTEMFGGEWNISLQPDFVIISKKLS